jgi:Ni/Co efflux regulator RcnB
MKMNKPLIAGLAALATLATPMAAAAQSWRDHDRQDRYERRDDRHDRRDDRYDRRDDRYDRRSDRRDDRYDRRDYRRYDRDQRRDYHRWQRGSAIPREYRSRWYVSDYSRYGYRQPPRGYGYYRTDTGDVVLAAIATGVIISLLSN